ncbi:YaeP family protein [Photobacterium sp. GJ3]|uniref:YaeP family protein n=1 Tax=Photobacterium sp. GJ3 TaxID=2829502 RepID=UPI001B8C127E|nr:YaeP family protein [Photobacterium sp. GJ3]QUJ66887.1 YaeP family protein [Photobacterium sp. GJ3]
MKVTDCCDRVRQSYSQIGSGEQGYIPAAIACAVRALNEIAANTALPDTVRDQAAFAAANLLISDHEDTQ